MSEILRFVCGHCGKQLSAKPQHAGRSTRCPGCQKPVAVPLPAPVPSHSEELNDQDIFRLLGGSNSNQEADAGTETETANVTEPVQSDATSATSNEMQTEKSLAITGRFQRLAQLPRVIVVAVGILLVALVGLAGWSLTKSARTAPVAVDKQDDDFEAVAQRAAPAAVDKQNDNPPAAVVEKPRAESIDLLKGDLDETSLAYFKQKFPKSSNVDATVKFCSKIDSLWLEKMRIGEEEVPIDGTIESAQKQLDRLKRMTGKVHEIGEFVGRADPFLLREAYKFALCRAVVAQHRVDHNKKTRDGAATSAEMNAYSQAMKASEVHLPRTRHCYGVLKDAMEGLKLDTREFDDIFR